MDFKTQFINALKGYCVLRNIALEEKLSPILTDGKDASLKDMDRLWRELAHQSGDALFGLHFGEAMQLTALGIVGQIIVTCNTVGEALAKAASMVPILAEGFEIGSEVSGDRVTITLMNQEEIETNYPNYHRHMRDFLGALIIHELDGLITSRIAPLRIGVPNSEEAVDEYCRVFRCSNFKYGKNQRFVLKKELLAIPIISGNYRMQQYLESLLQDSIPLPKSLKKEMSLQQRVRAYIRKNSYLGILSMDDVAANFNMSSRTLQRKLKEDNSSFKAIVDDVRKELAFSYLKDRNNQIKDVAYSLGYNEPSAFVRAFKRWTGKSPTSYLQTS